MGYNVLSLIPSKVQYVIFDTFSLRRRSNLSVYVVLILSQGIKFSHRLSLRVLYYQCWNVK